MVAVSEEKSGHVIAWVLRYGSLVSTLIMALGVGLMLVRGPALSLSTYHRIRLSLLFPSLIRFDPAALTQFGILLLLFTPIFRILVAAVTFALERDAKYVLIALGVLAVVLVSISFALAG
jgi:uncharacterized membrane protein